MLRYFFIILLFLPALVCQSQPVITGKPTKLPPFSKRYSQWTIKNNNDSLTLLKLDTLVLCQGQSERSMLRFKDSTTFTFYTNSEIQSLYGMADPKLVVVCSTYREGKWSISSDSNTLKLILADKQEIDYQIKDMDWYNVLLIKQKNQIK